MQMSCPAGGTIGMFAMAIGGCVRAVRTFPDPFDWS